MKKVRIFALVLACLLLLSLPVSAAADAHADVMEVSLEVDQNGTAQANVSLKVTADEPLNSLSIGLGPNVSGVRLDGYSAKVRRVDGQTVVTVSGENGLPSSMDLHLSYTIRNTVESSGDIQHFAVRLLGGIQEAEIDKLTLRVKMPAAFEGIPEFNSGYHADGIDNYLDIAVSDAGILTAVSTASLLAGETMDLKIDMAPDYFTLYNVAGRTLLVDQIAMILLALFAAVYWWQALRSPMYAISAQSRPPMGLEPGVAGMLITGQSPDLALMVMNWAAKGYLRVVRMRGRKVMLVRQIAMGNERHTYEQEVFARLFARKPEVLCGSKAWLSAKEKAEETARAYWDSRLYEKKPGRPGVLRGTAVLFCGFASLYYADQVLPSMFLRILFLAIVTLAGLIWGAALQYALRRLPQRRRKRPVICLLLCVLIMVIVWNITGHGAVLLLALLVSVLCAAALFFGPRRKQSGAALQAELLGWRKYLRKLTQRDARLLLDASPQYYYETLLFAEALGIGRRFSRCFDGIRLDECAFMEREGKPLPRNAPAFRGFFAAVLAIARGEMKKPSAKAPAAQKKPAAAASRAGQPRVRNNDPRRKREEIYDPID